MTLLAIMIVFREEKIPFHQVVGLILGFIGVLIVFGAWNGLGTNPWWAIGALLLAVACYGVSFPYSRKNVLPLKLEPEVLAATQLVAATLTLLPFFLFHGISDYKFEIGPVFAMLGLGIFGSGFAYIWNFKIMSAAGSAIASSVTFVTPVVAVIVGIIFLGEKVTWNEPVGGLVVLLSAAIAQGRIKLKSQPAIQGD
jgi:drug/metabolite transporter (DMT)-like permease